MTSVLIVEDEESLAATAIPLVHSLVRHGLIEPA